MSENRGFDKWDSLQGAWPEDDLRRAFVEGAKWELWTTERTTMFGSEREKAEQEAERRYGQRIQSATTAVPGFEAVGIFIEENWQWRQVSDRMVGEDDRVCFLYREVPSATTAVVPDRCFVLPPGIIRWVCQCGSSDMSPGCRYAEALAAHPSTRSDS